MNLKTDYKRPFEDDKSMLDGGYGAFATTMNNNYKNSLGITPSAGNNLTAGATNLNAAPGIETGLTEVDATGEISASADVIPEADTAVTAPTTTPDTSAGTGTTDTTNTTTALGTAYVPTITGTMKDEATFISELGVDLDKEYEEGKAALEYDYMTSQANFGERAEMLAQMGLSGSGVSDIYNLAAFNSYLKAQNDLKYSIIEAKNQQKQQYNQYKAEWEAGYKSDSANAYNTALSIYDGTNAESVRTQLLNHGYSEDVINNVMNSISGLDVSTLPTIRAQAEQEVADVDNAFASWAQNYSADKKGNIISYYQAKGWSDDKINKLITQLDAYAGATGNAKIQNAYNTIVSENAYDPNAKESTREFYKNNGWTDAEVDQLFEMLDAYYGTRAEETVAPIIDKETGTVTIGDITGTLDQVGTNAGENSESYVSQKTKVSQKISDTFEWALETDGNGNAKRLGSSEVATVLGYDAEQWATLSDGEREAYVMDYAGNLYKSGYLGHDEYKTMVSNWISSEITAVKAEDESNTPFVYSTPAGVGDVAYTLLTWRDNGYINDADFNEYMAYIIDESGVNLNSAFAPPTPYEIVKNGLDIITNKDNVSEYKNVVREAKNILGDTKDTQGFVVVDGELYYYADAETVIRSTINATGIDERTAASLYGFEFGHGDEDYKIGVMKVGYDDLMYVGSNTKLSDEQRQGMYEVYKTWVAKKQGDK